MADETPTPLIDFLRARLDEDERGARAAGYHTWTATPNGEASWVYAESNGKIVGQTMRDYDASHMARHDPSRVLAEVAAKRAILDGLPPEHWVIRLLAQPYRSHPDFNPDWEGDRVRVHINAGGREVTIECADTNTSPKDVAAEALAVWTATDGALEALLTAANPAIADVDAFLDEAAERIKPHRMAAYTAASEELMAEAGQLREALTRALDPNAPKPPPPVDPGPNPDYLRLLDAAVAAARQNAAALPLTDLLTLHSPRWSGYGTSYQCMGDMFSGYDAEPPDWPCETVAVVAGHLGVKLGARP